MQGKLQNFPEAEGRTTYDEYGEKCHCNRIKRVNRSKIWSKNNMSYDMKNANGKKY